jgi:hypothetical protein
MSTKDRIWALVAKRVNDEASIEELQELDKLLKEYPGTDWQIKVIADWWREDIQEEIVARGVLIFEKIKEKIKENEDQPNRVKQRRPE